MLEFFIAKKHIFEKKRQSLIAAIGVAIGVTVLTVSIGIANGLDKNMINSILSMTSHVLVLGRGEIRDYENLSQKIEKIPDVKGVVPKISTQGIIKYKGIFGDYVSGVKVEGLDLKAAEKAMDLNKKIVKGTIDPSNNKGMLIGNELYKSLGANIGDKITLVSSEGKSYDLKIEGVFQSGYYDYDTSLVIIPLKTAQYITYSGDKVNSLDVMLNNPYKAGDVSKIIYEKYGIFNRTWGDLNRNLLSALSLEKTVMILVFSLIVIIAGFVVWVILNMLVREKIKDIGIMRSMGFSNKSIMKIFLLQGIFLGGSGIIIGEALSLGILWYIKNYSIAEVTSIYYLTKVPVDISIKEIGIIVLANIIIILLSSIFPAYRAGKMETVEALRHE
ncbi:lipoprotein-releasing system permease protein [Cetobacterium ceti]|uniref:Lipoprotein-releasing system permease protein n=1 Tax=Cetobacterium ceti TaxID=180163 RepID=A0A1T4KSG7_9FUSO|nr:ABC transporter permease [Cetobacterium ceti]SJZ45267.1 lipoprotein-releasing system permease protein [Cetobacterium ceti]